MTGFYRGPAERVILRPVRLRIATIGSLGLAVLLLAPACAPRRGPKTAPGAPAKSERALARGVASWYGKKFQGRRTASGERFDMHELTAAHPSLPFGTLVEVRNLDNGRSVVVRINDRGPSVAGRVIDVSYAAAVELGMIERGVAEVALYLAE